MGIEDQARWRQELEQGLHSEAFRTWLGGIVRRGTFTQEEVLLLLFSEWQDELSLQHRDVEGD